MKHFNYWRNYETVKEGNNLRSNIFERKILLELTNRNGKYRIAKIFRLKTLRKENQYIRK